MDQEPPQMNPSLPDIAPTPPHPRVLGWVPTTALAMGGSNQMIFLITALSSARTRSSGKAVLRFRCSSWRVSGLGRGPAWTELVLMWPDRVGGISAACAEAFRPYNPVLSALTGTC